MKTSSGFTLIEVMIAVFVLAVGVIAASSLQASALRSTSTARVIQDVTNTARAEIELQRQLPIRTNTGPIASQACSTTPLPAGHTCTVSLRPCRIQTGTPNSLVCENATIPAPIADEITVRVVGPQSRTIELRTVVGR